MFCSKCGADNPDGANFCIKCGHALNFTIPENKVNTVPAANQSLINETQNCNSLMIIGLIFSLLNYVPYVNVMSCIVSYIVTILGMCKVIAFCQKYVSFDSNAALIEKMTRTLRIHYIITLASGLFILFLAVLLVVAYDHHEVKNDDVNLILGLSLVALLIYNCAISIWCLVRWFTIREFILGAKAQLSKA
ncbi:zinc-ribbon domain-containing protein [Succinivibrio sp.]|uniref:zinc-ribbon domain-containing protein n=1 Tax=Succinivibrio sp. TaxID=2053619 RepID=UPI0038631FFF